MNAANASLAAVARRKRLAQSTEPGASLEVVARSDPGRADLEDFIAGTFARAYGARVDHFADHLVGVRRQDGRWVAGVGYTAAGADSLFIEQYVDGSIEAAIADRLGVPVARSQIVEVGNLAANSPGAARRLIVGMTAHLHRLGYTWVVFTSTRALLNSFGRLSLAPLLIGPADPARLQGGVEPWGTYYDTGPQVMAGSIPIGFIHFMAQAGDARPV